MPVKLVSSEAFGDGDVMIYDDVTSSWRYICGNMWTKDDANVVCRQMGFVGAAGGTLL